MENSTDLAYSNVIVQHSGGEYVKQIRGRSHCPTTRRIATKNSMSSKESVKTKITGPLVTRKEGEKKDKEKLMVGQIKLYIYGIEVHRVGCEPIELSQ